MNDNLEHEISDLFAEYVVLPIKGEIKDLQVENNFSELKNTEGEILKNTKIALKTADFNRGKEELQAELKGSIDKKIDEQKIAARYEGVVDLIKQVGGCLKTEVIVKEDSLIEEVNALSKKQEDLKNFIKEDMLNDIKAAQNSMESTLEQEIGETEQRCGDIEKNICEKCDNIEESLLNEVKTLSENQIVLENFIKKDLLNDIKETQSDMSSSLEQKIDETDKKCEDIEEHITEKCEEIENICNSLTKQAEFDVWKQELAFQMNTTTETLTTICNDKTLENKMETLTGEFGRLRKLVVGLMAGNCVMFAVIVVMFIMMFL